MGFFGDRDDEYLDEDEKRLLRESLKRRKAAARQNQQEKNSRYADYDMSKFGPVHKEDDGCEADHTDDGGADYSATANDEGCHADHSDDMGRGKAIPQSDPKRVVATVRRVLILSFVIPFVIFFVIGIILEQIPDEEDEKPSNNKPKIVVNVDDTEDSDYYEKMTGKSQEILDEIIKIDYQKMSRREIYNFIDETFPYQMEDDDFSLCAKEVLKLFDYKEHAYNCIAEEFPDFKEDDISDIKKELHKRGFTSTEIESALAKFE